MDGVVEIVTGRERRRRWGASEKLRIVAEAAEPGAVMRAVAARHGVCESLLFTWRRQARAGTLREAETPVFTPVRMLDTALRPVAAPSSPPERATTSAKPAVPADHIEIELGDGRRVRVGNDVNLAALRRVLVALRG
jgi:transposase